MCGLYLIILIHSIKNYKGELKVVAIDEHNEIMSIKLQIQPCHKRLKMALYS
jgi:hypothetical protein